VGVYLPGSVPATLEDHAGRIPLLVSPAINPFSGAHEEM
jgi:hypothetical protein